MARTIADVSFRRAWLICLNDEESAYFYGELSKKEELGSTSTVSCESIMLWHGLSVQSNMIDLVQYSPNSLAQADADKTIQGWTVKGFEKKGMEVLATSRFANC
jgi:hypothetical protein